MSSSQQTLVVALGGNAITPESGEADIHHQFRNTRRSLAGVVDLVLAGHRVLLTHGNGPQVGNSLIRVAAARHLVPPRPLGVIVADLQGGMGYMIAQSLHNLLEKKGCPRRVVAVLTQVLVDSDDPSIDDPTKFVGLPYSRAEASLLAREHGFKLKEDVGRGWRRVVPSPVPRGIVERDTIVQLMASDNVVICAGGGGIPVCSRSDGTLEGVDAVVDKDLTTAILGKEVGADIIYILTAIDRVYLGYRTKRQRAIKRLSASRAAHYLRAGHFPPGTMGPKIQAAIDFLAWGGREAVITSVERFVEALSGRTGTRVVASDDPVEDFEDPDVGEDENP